MVFALSPGFFISAIIFFTLSMLFPVPGMGEYDEVDIYGAFTAQEAAKLGIVTLEGRHDDGDETSDDPYAVIPETVDKKE